MDFKKLLEEHQKRVRKNINKVLLNLLTRSQVHDEDKIYNKEIYNIYKKHFPKLKEIPYGTPEYKEYEQGNFKKAHQLHAQNDHHFYSQYNNHTKPNLIDLLEATIDIYSSMEQYNEVGARDTEEVLSNIKKKGITEIELDEYLRNTIDFLKEN